MNKWEKYIKIICVFSIQSNNISSSQNLDRFFIVEIFIYQQSNTENIYEKTIESYRGLFSMIISMIIYEHK